ncbi:MAG: GntR family transcriptional regulator [Burkholderiales bacterium]|nr:GntR family transcriptional regulator [Burkholderiales bacterium]
MNAIARIELAPDLTEQVRQRLLEAICTGDLAPGARVTQEELAASLAVSRQPVLQALRLLKRDGFVTDAGRRGLMVAPLEARTIAQVYQVRGMLDGLAARQAAAARVRIDREVVADGRRAAAGGRLAPMIDADMRFHRLLYAASGNPFIEQTANLLWHHIRRAMGAALQSEGLRASVWDEHAVILDTVEAGDAERAERLAREHGEAAGRNLAARLTQRTHDERFQPPDTTQETMQ